MYNLKRDVKKSTVSAYAEGTRKNMRVHWKAFLLFCTFFNLLPLPASLETICLFIQFLSRSFKSVESIKNYVSGVCTLHLFLGHAFPSLDEFGIKLLYRGIARDKAHLPRRALPITPQILLEIKSFLNMNDANDASVWCLFLFAFYCMARKSNLVPDSSLKFNKQKQLSRGRIELTGDLMVVNFRWSKTNQFGNRVLKIPMVRNPQSSLCPVAAYDNMCKLVPASGDSPAFLYKDRKGLTPITYSIFQRFIKDLIRKSGRNPADYSSHSFRRGGATFSFRSQVPSEMIKLIGDWASDAYFIYLEFSLEDKIAIARKLAKSINI